MKRTAFIITIICFSAYFIASCSKDKGTTLSQGIVSDEELFKYLNSQTLSFYKDQPTQLTSTAVGGHSGGFHLKFNNKAKSALGADGKLPVGGSFPDSSLVVKELLNANGDVSLYAIMLKAPQAFYARSGWIWAEYNADGSTLYSLKKDASVCIGCHTGGRDYLWSFDAHP